MLLVYFLLVIGPVLGTELCKEKEWYDDLSGKCHKCTTCVDKLWEAAPCSSFMDTLCVDLREISRSISKSIKAGEVAHAVGGQVVFATPQPNSKHHKWHEMEVKSVEKEFGPLSNFRENTVSKSLLNGSYDQWDIIFILILSVLLLFFILMVILVVVKYIGNPLRWDHNKVARSRLFSRDRLNTTEYMNNLATLDRRLCIDEILEKKKKAAIFEPQLLKENIYVDEAFIDISGLPRNLRNDQPHDYEEIDHRRCLLEMQNQQ